MNIERHKITIAGLPVEIVKKKIKNLHLGVYPPSGRVRVAAPLHFSDESVRLAVIGKLGWIKRQQAKFERQLRQSEREMVSGESHYFAGRRYRLHVYATIGPARVAITNNTNIELHVLRSMNVDARRKIMANWYRQYLKMALPPLIEKWQKRLGVSISEFRIKKMKTRWGTCSIEARRIWINLELAKKSSESLEYVVAHELAHLLARRHDDRFIAFMDAHMPRWKIIREELNCLPLAHEAWRE